MNLTRVLVNIGGVVGLSLALTTFAQPPAEPAKDQPTPTPAPAAPAVPAKDAEPARVMSKEAADLLAKAAEAGKAAKDLSANISISMKNNGEEMSRKGKLTMVLKEGRVPFGNWRIETAADKADLPAKVSAFDGKTVRAIDTAKKEMTETPATGGVGSPIDEDRMLLPMWFFEQRQPDMFARMKPTIVEQAIEGEVGGQKIGDEKVTVVHQIRTMTLPVQQGAEDAKPQILTETIRLSLGADNLPRRAERTMEVKGGDEAFKQEIVQSYEGLKVNTTPADDTFVLKAPEGYTTRQVAADDGSTPEMKFKDGDTAPDFALKDADGKEYKLADFKGKVMLLDFWATWCPPCREAMPHVQKLHEEFKDKAVAVMGVDVFERGGKTGTGYMKEKGFTYLSLLNGDELAKAYGISSIPTMILIGKDGKILHIAVGFDEGEIAELKKLINDNLK